MRTRVRALLPPNFFFVFFFNSPAFAEGKKTSAFAEGGAFFCPKKLRIFLIIYYINCRFGSCFTEDLRPPHFWQTSSNSGSLGRGINHGRLGGEDICPQVILNTLSIMWDFRYCRIVTAEKGIRKSRQGK